MTNTSTDTMSVQTACEVLGDERSDALAVLTMSAIAFWPEVREDDYRLMGLMGAAGAIGLGLALGLPERPVWVLDGDGSLLMQLGVVSAIAEARPANLTHVVFDNGIYAISGAQPTPTPASWEALLLAAGYASATTCTTVDELHDAIGSPSPDGPRGIVVRCESIRPDYPAGAFAVDPAREAHRVRAALDAAGRIAGDIA